MIAESYGIAANIAPDSGPEGTTESGPGAHAGNESGRGDDQGNEQAQQRPGDEYGEGVKHFGPPLSQSRKQADDVRGQVLQSFHNASRRYTYSQRACALFPQRRGH